LAVLLPLLAVGLPIFLAFRLVLLPVFAVLIPLVLATPLTVASRGLTPGMGFPTSRLQLPLIGLTAGL